ncbi:MAG TPA: sugar ABC transporter permease [Phycisphaerae bacterium]|nr:sugar ABC transporter permease [Phycisphaerae bacterium]
MSVAARSGLWASVRRNQAFYLFLAPFGVMFAVFGLYPLGFSLYLSFVKWDGLTEKTWVGLGNFLALADDEVFLASIWNTLVIGLLYVPPMLIAAFLFAVGLNASWLRLRGVLRAAFFLPAVTPMVAVAVVFTLLYGVEAGLLNHALKGLGLDAVPWLVSETWSKPSVAILLLWRWTGYNMLLMLAGLQGISPEYYEAAAIDGAGAVRRLWHITLPLMRPIFIFCLITSIIGTVYMFDEVFVLTEGGPGTSSTNIGMYLFNISFSDYKFGYASAVAYTTAVAVFVVSLLILRRRTATAAA